MPSIRGLNTGAHPLPPQFCHSNASKMTRCDCLDLGSTRLQHPAKLTSSNSHPTDTIPKLDAPSETIQQGLKLSCNPLKPVALNCVCRVTTARLHDERGQTRRFCDPLPFPFIAHPLPDDVPASEPLQRSKG
uniref:Uncharacterized protein n=1 Tax=Cryptomonas paramaecium TaxID=2898 RepID=A0A7S4PSA6_9CRYP|mmetsp:Transcript_1017/g.2599  ORF Transcript_1017/g.2599 Transcript_1017/m.2599 type:complete len:132 (+) Transcript_1017:343-738(+)